MKQGTAILIGNDGDIERRDWPLPLPRKIQIRAYAPMSDSTTKLFHLEKDPIRVFERFRMNDRVKVATYLERDV